MGGGHSVKPVAFTDRCLDTPDRRGDTLTPDAQESLLPISVLPDLLALVVFSLSPAFPLFDASLSQSPPSLRSPLLIVICSCQAPSN